MLHRSLLITASVLALTVASVPHNAWAATTEAEAKEALAEFEKADPGIKASVNAAAGYAIFPTVDKGAIGIGGAYGDGLVYEKGKLIGTTTLTQVTIGLALGGQAYRELILFQNKQALDRFTGGNFEFDAQASAVGATSGVSIDAAYKDGVAITTIAKGGLMFEASIGGQKFSYKPK